MEFDSTNFLGTLVQLVLIHIICFVSTVIRIPRIVYFSLPGHHSGFSMNHDVDLMFSIRYKNHASSALHNVYVANEL